LLTSPRPGTSAVNPLPDQARHAPTLRANPCPEVTDPICRLPLPTLVYRLEALDLGDLLRIWVRAGATPPRDPHPDFQGPTGLPGHRSNCGALRVPLRISLREDSTEPERSGRKENSSRGSRRHLWGLSRYRVNTRIVFAAPQPGSVIGNGFPFARRTGFTVPHGYAVSRSTHKTSLSFVQSPFGNSHRPFECPKQTAATLPQQPANPQTEAARVVNARLSDSKKTTRAAALSSETPHRQTSIAPTVLRNERSRYLRATSILRHTRTPPVEENTPPQAKPDEGLIRAREVSVSPTNGASPCGGCPERKLAFAASFHGMGVLFVRRVLREHARLTAGARVPSALRVLPRPGPRKGRPSAAAAGATVGKRLQNTGFSNVYSTAFPRAIETSRDHQHRISPRA
jgi:hypothetical protein